MSEALNSVYSFSEDVGSAEAPSPLPVGEYRGTVRSIANTVSKNSQKPMMVLTYLISPDQYPADFTEGNPDGEAGNVYFVVNDDARGRYRMRKFCEHHGVQPGREIDSTAFIGSEVILQVTHEEYNGEKRTRFNPIRAA